MVQTISFYPRGSKLGLFWPHRQSFSRYGPIFKLAIFGHDTWPLAKFQKLHIDSLSTPGGRNWACFHSIISGFGDTGQLFSKLPYLGMIPEAHILSFSPSGRNWAYFHSAASGFGDTAQISKLPLGPWPVAKVPEAAHILLFYTRGSKLGLFSLYREPFLRYWPIFTIAIFRNWQKHFVKRKG